MTQLGLNFLEFKENRRSNVARENENRRHNVATETEERRSNVANEAIKRATESRNRFETAMEHGLESMAFRSLDEMGYDPHIKSNSRVITENADIKQAERDYSYVQRDTGKAQAAAAKTQAIADDGGPAYLRSWFSWLPSISIF